MDWGTVKKGMAGCKSVEEGSGKMQGFSYKWRERNPRNGERKGK